MLKGGLETSFAPTLELNLLQDVRVAGVITTMLFCCRELECDVNALSGAVPGRGILSDSHPITLAVETSRAKTLLPMDGMRTKVLFDRLSRDLHGQRFRIRFERVLIVCLALVP